MNNLIVNDFIQSTNIDDKLHQMTKSEWKNLPCEITETGLKIGDSSVVEYWEEPIQKQLAKLTANKGSRILEVGFGLGLASKNIQCIKPEQHIIIEAHPEVAKHALQEHIKNHNVIIISSFWEDVIEQLVGGFDGIVFDTYPTDGSNFVGRVEDTINLVIPFLHYSASLLKSNGVICFIDFFGVDENRWFEIADDFGLTYESRHLTNVKPPHDCSYTLKANSYIIKMIK